MARRHYVNNAPVTTLSGGVTAIATAIPVVTATGFPVTFPWTGVIDAGTASAEIVLVTSAVGTTLTVTRGFDGSGGQSHALGAVFAHEAVQADYDEANAHVNTAAGVVGVHGLAGALVGTTDIQTLSNKTLTSPTVNGGTQTAPFINSPTVTLGLLQNLQNQGDGTHPALVGKATTVGGQLLALRNSAGTDKFTVADTGNVVTAGSVAAASAAITGAITGASATLSGAVSSSSVSAIAVAATKVTSIFQPTIYADVAALTAALVSPTLFARAVAGTTEYIWNGSAWYPAMVAGSTAYSILTGTAAITGTTNFGVTFPSAPMVTATLVNSGNHAINVTAITTTNFSWRAFRTPGDNATSPQPGTFSWMTA